MPTYHATLFNCPMMGDEFSDTPEGGKIRNKIRLAVGGMEVELIQKPALINADFSKLRGQVVQTTDLFIHNLEPGRLNDAEACSQALSWMLSLATSSEVVCGSYDFAGANPPAMSRAFVATLEYFRPAFSPPLAHSLKAFLQQGFSYYQDSLESRRLNVAIGYYVASQKQDAMELNLVATFVLLEHLKHTFGHAAGLPYIKGYFRDYGKTEAKPGQKKSFKELLTSMLSAVSMSPVLGDAINLRNEIIHSGISELNYQQQWAIYNACQDIIREYLLRFLNYRGEYHKFSDTSGKTYVIS